MNKNNLFGRSLVLGIVVLFVGAVVVPSISSVDQIALKEIRIENFHKENLIGDIESFYPTDDAFYKQNYPDDNFGAANGIKICNRYDGATNKWERDGLIRFDLSSIPPGTLIISATLKLYYFMYLNNDPVDRELTLYRISSDWNEDTVTWNTRPSIASVLTSSAVVPDSTGVWMEWDITKDTQDFISGQETNYGWQIMDENYWGSVNIPITKFYTKEYGDYIPYLEITFLICGDVNNDGNIDVADVVYLINYLFIGGPEPQLMLCVGDANGDETVDIADVVYLINYLFIGGPEPAGCCE